MVTTNGTDEGVLREWLNREIVEWEQAFAYVLDESIQHLQDVCFVAEWDRLIASGTPEDEVGRLTLTLYEQGLGDIFGFARASGAIPNDIAWSTMKLDYRRAADEAEVAPAIREALDSGFYLAERWDLGDIELFRSWGRCLMLFIYQHAAAGPEYPGRAAEETKKLAWAYEALRDIEDHETFHLGLEVYLSDPGVEPVIAAIVPDSAGAVLGHERAMLELARFDLVLNTALNWLVDAVERD